MKNKYIIITIIALLLGSCTNLKDNILDGLPADQFPENEAQIATIPIPTYQALQSFVDNAGWWFAQEVTSDEMTCPTRGEHWDDGGKWRALHEHTWDNNTEAVNTMWSHFYDGTFQANSALDLLATFEQTDDLKVVAAKLKVMRAFYYWQLIDNYGDVPYLTTLIDAPEYPEKETRANIFNSLVSELEKATPLLSSGGMNTSVTKGMAYTLLAKLYLNSEVYSGTPQWLKAEKYCDSVIELGTYSLETNALGPFITDNQNSPENIFTIPYDEDEYKGFNLHMRTLHYNSNLTFNMTVGPWNGFAVMEDHYNSYDDNDARKQGFLIGQQYDYQGNEIEDGTTHKPLVFTANIPALNMQDANTEAEKLMSGARVVKFEIALGAKDNLSNDFPLFRYADVLLMKAEAMIRQGKNGDDYVNMIRNRAGLSDWNSVTLDMLLAERGREMFWEGHRRQDLIRFGKFGDAWWEKQASSSDREIFPIPQWAIDANPNLAK
ncbi:RagB/SusD family nutrient uptake outer membrane protein [Lutibacter sp.]